MAGFFAMKHAGLKSFLIAFAVWLIFAWPLPNFFSSAIPAGTTRLAADCRVSPMEPGDHLQLLYHFWLFSDFLAGKTPWFHNLYEFNTGDDSARLEPGAYYFPFSLFFAIGRAIHGNAFGWNLTGLLSLWLTYLFTWKLARRYCASDTWAALASLVSITLPYRWISLNGGSPTGFAMMWVPVLLLGLDLSVRDLNWRGGLLAGTALLMANWGDLHVFFFAGLVTPCWCVLALVYRGRTPLPEIRNMAKALIPVPVLAAAALWTGRLITRGMASSPAAGGRDIQEVRLFSPRGEGLFAWRELGVSNHVYVGFAFMALLLGGLILFAAQARRQKRNALVYLLLLAGIAGILLLALGPFGPFAGGVFRAARKVIPQYAMLRQPAKILCLLSSLFAVAAALAASVCASRFQRALMAGLMMAGVFEFKAAIMPILCPLDRQQAAYAAVAGAVPSAPRALALPLWPGDSHYTSVYQYYAMLYRIRLVNGYRPFVPKEYHESIGRRFENANLGWLSDDQMDDLLGMGVQSIILHEDLFPEKVSPFPVGFTLKNLLEHPRLQLLAQDGPVWSFRIEERNTEKRPPAGFWKYLFPARVTPVNRMKARGGQLLTRATQAIFVPDIRWMIRARGTDPITCETYLNDKAVSTGTVEMAENGWQWIEFLLPEWDGAQMVYPRMSSGSSEVDCVVLAAGEWPRLKPGEEIEMPAPCFFHGGYTDMETASVILRKDREHRAYVFYGPKMPFEPGTYSMRVDFTSDAVPGTVLGCWVISCPEGREIRRMDVLAGESSEREFFIDQNSPLLLALHYFGTGDMTIRSVTLRRLD